MSKLHHIPWLITRLSLQCAGIRVTNRLDTENDEMNKRVRFSNEKTYVVYENFTDYVYGSEKEKCGEQKIFLEVGGCGIFVEASISDLSPVKFLLVFSAMNTSLLLTRGTFFTITALFNRRRSRTLPN